MNTALAGKSKNHQTRMESFVHLLTIIPRLMVWAIDLDDGSLLDALFGNTGHKKRKTRDITDNDNNVNCFVGGINGG